MGFGKLAGLLFGLAVILAAANYTLASRGTATTPPVDRPLSYAERRALAGSDLPTLPTLPGPSQAVDLAPTGDNPVVAPPEPPQPVTSPGPAAPAHVALPQASASPSVSFVPGQPMVDPNPSR